MTKPFLDNKHVYEIVSMALDLLGETVVFQIPQMPNYRLQIRMGIHSGPVVGIVAGSKLPKYRYSFYTIHYCLYRTATRPDEW